MPEPTRLLISCEHGGNRVPADYRLLFAGKEELLTTHQGYDIGILSFARLLAREFAAPLHAATVTRLLVDLNRSRHSPTLFSPLTRTLPDADRASILNRHYDPYRQAVATTAARQQQGGGRVVHLSVHSFTPVLHGEERQVDVGLLYDPGRAEERLFCRLWQQQLRCRAGQLRVRRNAPYRGVSDSLVKALRARFAAESYLGIEIEINQRFPLQGGRPWKELQSLLVASLRELPFPPPERPPAPGKRQ